MFSFQTCSDVACFYMIVYTVNYYWVAVLILGHITGLACLSRSVYYCPRKRRQYCFLIVTKFFLCFSVYTVTHEPLHLAWWNSAWTCILTTSRILLNVQVIGQRSRSQDRIFGFSPLRDRAKNVCQHDDSWTTALSLMVKFCMNVDLDNVRKLIEYQCQRSRSHGCCVFCVCMILLEPVGLDSRNVGQAWPAGST